MISLSGHYTPNEFHLTPSVIIVAGVYENPECRDIHGWQFVIHFFWWAGMITWEPEE